MQLEKKNKLLQDEGLKHVLADALWSEDMTTKVIELSAALPASNQRIAIYDDEHNSNLESLRREGRSQRR